MGERTVLFVQAKSTADGSPANRSGPDMQHADQREQTAGGVDVHLHTLDQPLTQEIAAFVVQTTAPHVYGFNLRR